MCIRDSVKTAEALAEFLNKPLDEIVKTMVFKVQGEYILILVRGHHEINEVKVKDYFQTEEVEIATEDDIVNLLGAHPGSLGPITDNEVKVYADNHVQDLTNLVIGANEDGYHYVNANADRDFTVEAYSDFRFITEGEPLADGSGEAKFAEGIEVGQVFKLGTKYSEPMNATFLDDQGKAQPLIMGCYGIGVSRTLSAVVEQNSDDRGIIWPKAVSPFDLHIITVNPKKEEQRELGEELYAQFNENYDVLHDDRKQSPGVKFNDADLIGIPVRIVVGKKAGEGIVEVKRRDTGDSDEVSINDVNQYVANVLKEVK